MRFVVLVVVVDLLVAHAITSQTSVGTSVEFRTKTWLRKHHNAKPDELAAFKNQDPQGYALVKALLTKRSLGLLDPRRPTADFSSSPPRSEDEDRAVGQAAFAKFANPGEFRKHAVMTSESAEVFPDVDMVSSSSHNWLSWTPPQNDDAMVAGVLGTASQLKSGSLISHDRGSARLSHLSADEVALNTRIADAAAANELPEAAAAPPPKHWAPLEIPAMNWANPFAGISPVTHAKTPIAVAPRVPRSSSRSQSDNPYLAGIDFLAKATPEAAAPSQKIQTFDAARWTMEAPRTNKMSPASMSAVPPSGALDFNAEIAKISLPDEPALREVAPPVFSAPPAVVEQKPVEMLASKSVLNGGDSYLNSIGFNDILSTSRAGADESDDQETMEIVAPTPWPIPSAAQLDSDMEAVHESMQPVSPNDFPTNLVSKSDASFAERMDKLSQVDIASPQVEALGDWLVPQKEEAKELLTQDKDAVNPYLTDLKK